jgi:hypothetical protein
MNRHTLITKAGAVRFWTTWFITDWGCRKSQGVWGLTGSGLGFGNIVLSALWAVPNN